MAAKTTARALKKPAPKKPAPIVKGDADGRGAETLELTQEEEVTAQAAIDLYSAEAMAIPAAKVASYRTSPALALVNVKTTMKMIAAHRADIPSHLPKLSLARLDGLPNLALALAGAAQEAEKTQPSEKLVSQNVAEARTLRGKLMPVLQGLCTSGLIPMNEYDDIYRGKGSRDVALDCVAIPAVFTKYAKKIAGKHAASAADLASAATVGAWLLKNLRAGNAPRVKGSAPSPAVELRNRLATLLQSAYSDAEAVAFYFHREDYAQFAPPLNSRHVATKKPAAKKPPMP